jgi:hypothetical protein
MCSSPTRSSTRGTAVVRPAARRRQRRWRARIAPAEIRDAVTILVSGIRAEASEPAVQAPDDPALEQATATIETFEDQNCRYPGV